MATLALYTSTNFNVLRVALSIAHFMLLNCYGYYAISFIIQQQQAIFMVMVEVTIALGINGKKSVNRFIVNRRSMICVSAYQLVACVRGLVRCISLFDCFLLPGYHADQDAMLSREAAFPIRIP